MNHAVRTEAWRYIRYREGGEEFYDETKDPYEWTNLAGSPEIERQKSELAKFLPSQNTPARGPAAATKEGRNKAGKKKAKS